jgi:hypothetical protein
MVWKRFFSLNFQIGRWSITFIVQMK